MAIEEIIKDIKISIANNSIGLESKQEVKQEIIDNFEELKQYRTIGTVEEFKCYRNDNDFSEYADKLYKTAYNKAIDEFAEKIKKKGIENAWNCYDVYGDCCGVTSCEECENDFLREIEEIAEQIKAGVDNGT